MIKNLQRLALLLSLFFLISAMPNYQERAIYLSERDNACIYGSRDTINVVVNIDGKQTIKGSADGWTVCHESILPTYYWQRISPGDQMRFLVFDAYYPINITLHQETKHVPKVGSIYEIIQKVTVKNPASIRGFESNCIIFGDGKVQHFGVGFEDFSPATIYLKCDSLEQKEGKSLKAE